ncbi:MAG: RodZ domain-containing protein [Candidatus Limnocylindria bacterium]
MTEDVHKLGEVLRAAREAKGVELPRVERETKIRERYLSALERGEYRELPGAVYTKGFLRNYGAYLGLDPEYLIDLYRLETAATVEKPRVPAPPRPLATRRSRAFVVTPGAVVGAILTIGVGAFIALIGYQLVTFARMPELRITQPPGDVRSHDELTYTVRGVTEPNARITVTGLRENPTVDADADGSFEITVELVPGSNVLRLVAFDPVTERDSEPVERTIRVELASTESPSPDVPALALEQPAADAAFTGPVPLAGTAAPAAVLEATAALVTAASPTFTVVDGTGAAVTLSPEPPTASGVPITVADDGSFTGSMALRPGTWDVTVTPADGEPITRRVSVGPAAGLIGTLSLEGGQSYLEVEQDGTALADVTGTIADEGDTIMLQATDELRIRAGNAGAVGLIINGISIGAMGEPGAVVEWNISRAD